MAAIGAHLPAGLRLRPRRGYGRDVPVTHVFAGVPVANRDVAFEWYERLVGRPPDLIPHANEVAWRLAEQGWVYVVVDEERAGSALLTLLVDDIDGFLADVERRGIEFGARETIGDGVPYARASDPDGNLVSVGQPPA